MAGPKNKKSSEILMEMADPKFRVICRGLQMGLLRKREKGSVRMFGTAGNCFPAVP